MEGARLSGGLGDPVKDRLWISITLMGAFGGLLRGRPGCPGGVVSSGGARGVAGAVGGRRGRAVLGD